MGVFLLFVRTFETKSTLILHAKCEQTENNPRGTLNKIVNFNLAQILVHIHSIALLVFCETLICYTHAVFFFHENDALHCIKMFWDVDSNIIHNLNNKWDCLCADCASFNGLANFGRNLLTLVNLLVELNNGFKLKANGLVIRYALHANLIWIESNPMSYLLLFSSPPQ